jgi:hypothetical protein
LLFFSNDKFRFFNSNDDEIVILDELINLINREDKSIKKSELLWNIEDGILKLR